MVNLANSSRLDKSKHAADFSIQKNSHQPDLLEMLEATCTNSENQTKSQKFNHGPFEKLIHRQLSVNPTASDIGITGLSQESGSFLIGSDIL